MTYRCRQCGRTSTCRCAFEQDDLCKICGRGQSQVPLDLQMELSPLPPNAPPSNDDLLSELLLIPRLFHFVWVGGAPFPEKDASWVESWLSHHPDWRAILWAENPTSLGTSLPQSLEVRPIPPLVNRRFYNGIEQWVTGRAVVAARSDIVRMELLARFGGIYLDTDVECFQNVESLMRGVRLFYADEWGPAVGNYMFGGVPNHPALWTLVRELGPFLSSQDTALNAVEATGPHYLALRLRQHPDCVIFPHMFFNPLCAYDDPAQVTRWPDVSFANHHYDGKWYDRTKNKPPQEFLR